MAATGLSTRSLLACALLSAAAAQYAITEVLPSSCKATQFFDATTLACKNCPQNTIPAPTGYSCACDTANGYIYLKNFGGGQVLCQKCSSDKVASSDGWSCISCNASASCSSTACSSSTSIFADRSLSGSQLAQRLCVTCDAGTGPKSDGSAQCVRCTSVLTNLAAAWSNVTVTSRTCSCADDGLELTGGYCFNKTSLPDANTVTYTLHLPEDGLSIESQYLTYNLRAMYGLCNLSNSTGCEHLGHMCMLLYYSLNVRASGSTACVLYQRLSKSANGPVGYPWLYFTANPGQTADAVLQSTSITTQFSFNKNSGQSKIVLKAAAFSLNGTYMGLVNVSGGLLQLCPGTLANVDAAWTFGTYYTQQCSLNVDSLFQGSAPVFYDVYLEYTDSVSNTQQLFPVPVRVQNYLGAGGNADNNETDTKKWQLTRRLYLVDNVLYQKSGQVLPEIVNYAMSITITVPLIAGSSGKIYPPYISVIYAAVAKSSYNTQATVPVSFTVIYQMDQSTFTTNFNTAIGVLGGLAALWAAVRTWSWSKRSGRLGIDIPTLGMFLIRCCSTLSYAFFAVLTGAALWWIIFFKRQDKVTVLALTSSQELSFVNFIYAAMALKVIDLIYMCIVQTQVDIFLVDWEKPRAGDYMQRTLQATGGKGQQEGTTATAATAGGGGEKRPEQTTSVLPVSIWRMFFVANEWNELQTIRKSNAIFQILAVLVCLNVIGFEYVCTSDPTTSFTFNADAYRSPDSRVFRFAVASVAYLIIAGLQWLFFTFLWERFIADPVMQFVDLCSWANVSIFLLQHSLHGYYLHGRSPHGRSDTDLKEMYNHMKREQEDLCSRRGLLPDTDQQTFTVVITKKFEFAYKAVMAPVLRQGQQPVTARMAAGQGNAGAGGAAGGPASEVQKSIEVHSLMTHFLSAFIDHSHKDLDYTIRDKTLMENLLDTEFLEPTDKGVFYNDKGHQFDEVLFYGNELSLVVFDTLVFCFVDALAQNFVLAAAITYFVGLFLRLVRDASGRKNLANKTQVDERFLI